MMIKNAVAVLAGEVRGITNKEFIDEKTGEIQDRGRELRLATETGFVTVRVPKDKNDVAFVLKAHVGLLVELAEWSFNNRTGVSLIFDSFVDPKRVQPFIDKAVYGDLAEAAK